MSRPLLITDCDEVLLHMIVPFRDWLNEAHDVHFCLDTQDFISALRRKTTGAVLERGEVWTMLRAFFANEMHRQYPIEGAIEALERLSELADVVVLTNIAEQEHEKRIDQLRALGLSHPIHWNQGGKGEPTRRIIDEYRPSTVLFIDDLSQHHQSVAEHASQAWRLHMVGEPLIANRVAIAPHAHARIDRWIEAESWIRERLASGSSPPDTGPGA